MAEAYRWRSGGRVNQTVAAAVCRDMALRRIASSVAALAAVCGLALVQAKISQASFHLMQVREVYPGSVANPASEYVELQMWSPGQNLVSGHPLHIFDSTGMETGGANFAANVPNGSNQSTLLLATPQAVAQLGIAADAELPGAGTGTLDPSGGKVCFDNIDCVSWGSFSGSSSQPSPSGTPAVPAGIPDGSALRRSIAPGCPTLLESGDDHDNSALDFAAAAPAPRANATPPSEIACTSTPPQGPAEGHAPQTILKGTPGKRIHDHTPSFRFRSNHPGSSFQCRVDRKAFRPCRSPFTAKALAPGRHRFQVRARSHGETDPTPASYTFAILR
jgi:hypothetical protein